MNYETIKEWGKVRMTILLHPAHISIGEKILFNGKEVVITQKKQKDTDVWFMKGDVIGGGDLPLFYTEYTKHSKFEKILK